MATKPRKTDNSNLHAKLELRRYFLKKYHGKGDVDVMDCCQGDAAIWSRLREEFKVKTYVAADLKPKKGRHKIDSSRLLALPGLVQNVIDVDTYGGPWKHYFALLSTMTKPTTVFLTVGQGNNPVAGQIPQVALTAAGLGPLAEKIPRVLGMRISEVVTEYALFSCYKYGIVPIECAEAESGNVNARYLGIHLKPEKARS